jgi:hypothetical protein
VTPPTRWEDFRKQFKFVVRDVEINFICPKCHNEIPVGNPGLCPHKDYDAPSVKYDPRADGPVDGLPEILRKLGYFALADQIQGKRRP